jgi:hypothetical protein
VTGVLDVHNRLRLRPANQPGEDTGENRAADRMEREAGIAEYPAASTVHPDDAVLNPPGEWGQGDDETQEVHPDDAELYPVDEKDWGTRGPKG